MLTVLAVTQFGADAHLKRTLGRVAGTVAGAVIAAIVASVSSSEAELVAIGLVLLVITAVIMLGPHPYVLYSIFLTPTVVLFTSTSIADVTTTDAQRVGFTLIGLRSFCSPQGSLSDGRTTNRPTASQLRLNRSLKPACSRSPAPAVR